MSADSPVFSIKDLLLALGWNADYAKWYEDQDAVKEHLLKAVRHDHRHFTGAELNDRISRETGRFEARLKALKHELERRNKDYANLCKKYQRVTRELHEIKHNLARDKFYGSKP